MKKSIKTKMIVNGVLSVSVSIILAMVIVFYLVRNQSQDAAEKRIDQAAQVVSVQFKEMGNKLIAAGNKIGASEFVGEQFQFIEETLEYNQKIDYILLQICDYIFEQGQNHNLYKLVIYDIHGKWISAVKMEAAEGVLLFPVVPGGLQYSENNVAIGDFAAAINWRVGENTLPILPEILPPIPSKPETNYTIEDGKFIIEVRSPIFDPMEKEKQVGLVLLSLVIDSKFIHRISGYTGTDVNLFIGTDLNVGMLEDYNDLKLKKGSDTFSKSGTFGIDFEQKIFRNLNLAKDKYFEGIFPIVGRENVIGSFNIMISREETNKNVTQMMIYLFFIAAACLLGVMPLTWAFANSILKPIHKVVYGIRDIAEGEGDLTVRLEIVAEDEVGELAHWFNTFADKLQGIIKKISENSEILNSSSSDLSSLSGEMSTSASTMLSRATAVVGISDDMKENMTAISSSMEEASTTMNFISESTEQLSTVLHDVANNCDQARSVTDNAVSQAQDASTRVGELGVAADQIGKVVETITEISEQTNLLALNATIESARAGEAGKGFAVVANEIKALARQTADATLEIKKQVQDIQKTSFGTTGDIKQISEVIGNVSEIVLAISSSVNEQSMTTKEIAENISQTSNGISEVTENIAHNSKISVDMNNYILKVGSAAQDISDNSDQVDKNSTNLSDLADALKKLVDIFKV